jgi:hypothetical protein
MKESWLYYDYLRRWGILLIVGVALGLLAGLGYNLVVDQQPLFKAKGAVGVSNMTLDVVSKDYSDPQEAFDSIVGDARRLDDLTEVDVVVSGILVEQIHVPPLWQPIVLGGLFGGLFILGAAWVWDDTRSYLRYRKQNPSQDA